MLNKVILMGRLTRDPELRCTQSNLPVVSFSLAIDRRNSKERQTDFVNVVAWRKTAEFVSQWFSKGMMMIVEGRLQSRSWQDENGKRRTAIEVVASEVQFGETKKSREASAGGNRNKVGDPANAPGAQAHPTPSYDMPMDDSDFMEMTDEEDGESPF